MISRLRGVLIEKRAPWLVLELTHGLGYEVEAPMSTFYRLPDLGHTVTLYTHFMVREDAHLLFGFAEARERALFRALIKVNGVGPKLALTILSSFEPDTFAQVIHHHDTTSLTRVPGIGKKTAERLLMELRDRLTDPAVFGLEVSPASVESAPHTRTTSAALNSPLQEALSALVALGYKPHEASKVVSQFDSTGLSCENIIRQALQRVMLPT